MYKKEGFQICKSEMVSEDKNTAGPQILPDSILG